MKRTMIGGSAKIKQIMERVAEAIADTTVELRSYMKDHPLSLKSATVCSRSGKSGRELSLQTF